MRIVKVSTCSLNQWAMDFDGNLSRIKESIVRARAAGSVFRVGPELEITGYGCEDHFLETDTSAHAWECLADLLSTDLTENMVCDIGMPVEHGSVRYNCRVFCLNRRILLIRPKKFLANDGNYRELRYFSGWQHHNQLVDHQLPQIIRNVTAQKTVPFGDAYLQFLDTSVAAETCEELFTPASPHIGLGLNGVEIIVNGSGSHHQLRKLNKRLDLMKTATGKVGGVYLYANQQGCDGGRLYYDGCASIVVNGDLVSQGSQFSLQDVEVLTAIADLDTISTFRGATSSLREQASQYPFAPYVTVDMALTSSDHFMFRTLPIMPRSFLPEEEIAYGPACWLWDYLRRSGATGYLLPLSGGADSASVAAIVGSMSQLVITAIESGDKQVMLDATRIGQYEDGKLPESSEEFASRVLHTVYMGSENSSEATCKRAHQLATEIGARHMDLKIDTVVSGLVSLFVKLTGKVPRYKVDGGTSAENLALQNLQARVRMVIAYMLASLLPWVRGKSGFFLVLGSANVDEGLRGYLTKYDCSSADLNPIGGISKEDIRSFLRWGASNLGYPILSEIVEAPPTAELEPTRQNYSQTDEEDMGMTYEELSMYGRFRKIFCHGPVSMYQNLCQRWNGKLTPAAIAGKVKDFFKFYSINRHKMTTITPCYHAENYSPDDNRFDHRQFLYNVRWPWQFKKIDEMVKVDAARAMPVSGEPTLAELATDLATGHGVPAVASGNPMTG